MGMWVKCLLRAVGEVSVFAVSAYFCYKLFGYYHLDQRHLVGKVEDIIIYPVVSCGPVEIPGAEVTSDGLVFRGMLDKQLVVCKKNVYPDPMIHYGNYSQIWGEWLPHIQIQYDATSIAFCADTRVEPFIYEPVNTERNKKTEKQERQQIVCHRSIYRGYKTKKPLENWFKRVVNESNGIHILQRKQLLWDKNEGRTKLGSISIANAESLVQALKKVNEFEDDETKLIQSVSVIRPNIIISFCRPFAEEKWKTVYIGKQAKFNVIGADIRMISNAIQDKEDDTAIRDTGENLTKTLPQISLRCGLKGCQAVGVEVKVDTVGEIFVGDSVYAVYNRPSSFLAYVKSLFKVTKPTVSIRNKNKTSSGNEKLSKSSSNAKRRKLDTLQEQLRQQNNDMLH